MPDSAARWTWDVRRYARVARASEAPIWRPALRTSDRSAIAISTIARAMPRWRLRCDGVRLALDMKNAESNRDAVAVHRKDEAGSAAKGHTRRAGSAPCAGTL